MASNPTKGNAQMADSTGDPLIGEAAAHFADLSIVYTTDDPGLTAGSATTIADGDLFPAGEGLQALTDVHAKINAIIAVLEVHGLMKDA